MARTVDVVGPLMFYVDLSSIVDDVVLSLKVEIEQVSGVSDVSWDFADGNQALIVNLKESAPIGHTRQRVRDLHKRFARI